MSSCKCGNGGCKCSPEETSSHTSKNTIDYKWNKYSKIFMFTALTGAAVALYGVFQSPKKNPKVDQYYSAVHTLESLRNYDLESKKRYDSLENDYITTFDTQNSRSDLEHTIYALENDSTELYNSAEVRIYRSKSEKSQNIVALGGVLLAISGYGIARMLNKKTKETQESKLQ